MRHFHFQPETTVRFSVGTYIKPFPIDNVLHMVKPTLTVSPCSFLFFHFSLEPCKNIRLSRIQISANIEKSCPFGSLQCNLFHKSRLLRRDPHPQAYPVVPALTPTQQLRQQVTLPLHHTKRIDFYVSKDTLFTSATLFEKKKTFFQSVREPVVPNPINTYPTTANAFNAFIIFFLPLIFVLSYFLIYLSKTYRNFEKGIMTRLLLISVFVLYIIFFFPQSLKISFLK